MGTAWLIALVCAATDLSLDARVRNEDRGGLLATGPTTPSVRAADFELAPRLTLKLALPETLLTLSYGPRLFYRVPDPLKKGALVFHQSELEVVSHPSPAWTWSTKAYVDGGDLDYSRALLVFDARTQTPASLPDTGIIRFLNAGATTTLAKAFSDVERLSSSLQASTNRPLAGAAKSQFPTQNRIELAELYGRALDPLDELQGSLSLSETWYRPGPAYSSLSPLVGWHRWLNHQQELTIHLGALLAATNGYSGASGAANVPTVSRGLRELPIVDAAYAYQGRPTGRTGLRGEITGGVTGFFEPVQAIVEPSGFVTLKGELTLSSATQVRAVGAVYAPLNKSSAGGVIDPFPTVAYANAAWHVAWLEEVATEVGVSANTRASLITRAHLKGNEPEVVGYVAVIAAAALLE